MKKLLVLIMVLAMVLLCGCDFDINGLVNQIIPDSRAKAYNEGAELFNSGDFAAAADKFLEAGDFKNSADLVKESYYQDAAKTYYAGDYQGAAEKFAKLDGYSNSAEMVTECKFVEASQLFEQGKFTEAKKMFLEIQDYSNCAEMAKECDYQYAASLYVEKDYNGAKSIFQNLGDYRNSEAMVRSIEKILDAASAEKEPAPTPTPVPTSTPIPLNNKPVMAGTSIDKAVEAAGQYGLTRAFEDEDFGNGTKCCRLATSNGGLTLNIVYDVESMQILCGNVITTNNLASASEQKEFINAIAASLCPPGDVGEVCEWVYNHIGGTETYSVSGFEYEVAQGPSGNLLYYAGNANWQAWQLSVS